MNRRWTKINYFTSFKKTTGLNKQRVFEGRIKYSHTFRSMYLKLYPLNYLARNVMRTFNFLINTVTYLMKNPKKTM